MPLQFAGGIPHETFSQLAVTLQHAGRVAKSKVVCEAVSQAYVCSTDVLVTLLARDLRRHSGVLLNKTPLLSLGPSGPTKNESHTLT